MRTWIATAALPPRDDAAAPAMGRAPFPFTQNFPTLIASLYGAANEGRMARRVIDVFLSSTAVDLAEHRKAVHERLSRTGLFHCVRQEDFGAQDAGAVEFCRRKAQDADLFVGLIGLRRGWEPHGDNEKRSITEMEHDWARDAGRPRYMWVMPDDFPLPGNLRESDRLHKRQMAFRKRIMGGGGRVVSQKGFDSPELLASEVVEQLLTQIVTTDLLKLIQPEAPAMGQPAPSKEEQAPAIAAAVERLAEDKDVDLLALAKDPKGIDQAELEAKLMAREKELEEEAQLNAKKRAEYWRHIGALAFLSDTHKSVAAYQKAVRLDPDDTEGWRYLGSLNLRIGEIAAARRNFEKIREIGQHSKNLRMQSLALVLLSWVERDYGSLGESESLVSQALLLAQDANWLEGIARARAHLGLLYARTSGAQIAESMQQEALRLWEELGFRKEAAYSRFNIGYLYFRRGQLEAAEEKIWQVHAVLEEVGDKEGVAGCCSVLGSVYEKQGHLDRAEDMQLKALELYKEMGRKEGMAASYGNLGNTYVTQGDLDSAEEMQLKALELYQKLDRKEGMADAYWNLGVIYDNRRDKAKMCECYRKARDLFRDIGMKKDADELEQQLRLNGCGGE
jgi:protein O-GlcNAc transferase